MKLQPPPPFPLFFSHHLILLLPLVLIYTATDSPCSRLLQYPAATDHPQCDWFTGMLPVYYYPEEEPFLTKAGVCLTRKYIDSYLSHIADGILQVELTKNSQDLIPCFLSRSSHQDFAEKFSVHLGPPQNSRKQESEAAAADLMSATTNMTMRPACSCKRPMFITLKKTTVPEF